MLAWRVEWGLVCLYGWVKGAFWEGRAEEGLRARRPCGYKEAEEWAARVYGPLGRWALCSNDKMLLKIFSVEKDKWISIWNLLKIVGGWGREKKTVFKIIPSVVFLKGLLASLLGEPHPDSEPLWGGWAVSQHLSRPWCWSETWPCDQEWSGAWGRGCGPKVWHPRKGDISSAKIRNQTKSRGGCSHSPYQPRGPPLWLRGEHKAIPAVLVSELSSAWLLRTLIIPSEHKVIQASQTVSLGLLVSRDSRTERWWGEVLMKPIFLPKGY